jgi:hypothetical protein
VSFIAGSFLEKDSDAGIQEPPQPLLQNLVAWGFR